MFQKSTLRFLIELKENNHKEWFDNNRDIYQKARTDFEQFVQSILQGMISSDPDLKELTPKSGMFRINRDIRFSKNKTPYKKNIAASLKKGGKKSIYAGYYFHLQPGNNSFYGGGLWMPEAGELKKIRQEIDYCFPEFKKIINNTAFKKTFGTFEREGQALVNIPKGYEKDNPAAEFLKLKSFFVNKDIEDKKLTDPSLVKEVLRDFKTMLPLIKFLNRSFE